MEDFTNQSGWKGSFFPRIKLFKDNNKSLSVPCGIGKLIESPLRKIVPYNPK